MPRPAATGLTLLWAAIALAAGPAQAIVLGSSSSLGSYTVRLVGAGYCTGVAIARRAVVTAAHCARGVRVEIDGGSIAIAGTARSAALDDGRRVSVSGDAVILRLASPLPFGVSAAPVGARSGDTFTIAGYGTTDERSRGAFGALHEATLVAASARALVDPNRSGSIGASACFGDSGGPVMRGGELVGVITRANYPRKAIACGFYTRWAAVTVSGEAAANAAAQPAAAADEPSPRHRRLAKHKREAETASFSLFRWFGQPATSKVIRRSARHKEAQR